MASTESRSQRYLDIENWDTEEAIEAMLEGQLAAVSSLVNQTTIIANASVAAAERLKVSPTSRLIYAGAGTSGRIAVQDGVELHPTYAWPTDRLGFVIAGGLEALVESQEGAEDNKEAGDAAIEALQMSSHDVLIGVAASGRTAFTIAAIEAAKRAGALTIGIANNPDTPLANKADFGIVAATGTELVAGSTRMKAGTAQKVVLNLLSTTIMLKLGRVYQGMMVDMIVSNEKLLERAIKMVAGLSGSTTIEAARALEESGRDIKTAILVAKGVPPKLASDWLIRAHGNLGEALRTQEKGSV
jgi:N-acetylmuramic acid 6-phosphate etherase